MKTATVIAKSWLASIEEMLAALTKAHDDVRATEEAQTTIYESVLSVLVRDDWRSPGAPSEGGPEEYEILLSTGGPALRIWGKVNDSCGPDTAELQMQDWGIEWRRYPAPEAVLLDFANCFYFGG
jgi:hypothetical protein